MSDLLYPVTIQEMIEEVRREAEKRREVYSRSVANHTMNRRLASRRISVMDEMLAMLMELQGIINPRQAWRDAIKDLQR